MAISFSEVLRRAILKSKLSRYEMWKETGIDQAVLSRFIHGKKGLSMESIDKLVDLLGLELRPRTRKGG